MSVDADLTRRVLREEMVGVLGLAAEYRWAVTVNFADLTVTVRMKSVIDGEEYIVEAACHDYRQMPPFFEFIHPETGERGTTTCYPDDGGRGHFFHSMPCICIQWNRKAYKVHDGPHADWAMDNWAASLPRQAHLGDMFHLIQRQINLKESYKGRKR